MTNATAITAPEIGRMAEARDAQEEVDFDAMDGAVTEMIDDARRAEEFAASERDQKAWVDSIHTPRRQRAEHGARIHEDVRAAEVDAQQARDFAAAWVAEDAGAERGSEQRREACQAIERAEADFHHRCFVA